MTTLPWRFLVLTEAGAEAGAPAGAAGGGGAGAGGDAGGGAAAGTGGGSSRPGTIHTIDSSGVDGWLRALACTIEAPLSGGRKAAIAIDRLASLEPESLAAMLAPGGSASPADLDAVLHHPAIQRLESAARGIGLVHGHAEGAVEIQVLAAARKEIAQRFREQVFDPLVDGSPSAWPSLILLDLDFSHKAEDLILLREIAALARVLQAPIVAGASPGFFDFRHFAHVAALPDIASRFMDPAHASWRDFQASDDARWIALTINRYLQREPYARESLGYTETAEEARPETFLWGRGVWLVGAAAARSVKTHGHALDLTGRGGLFEGLAARPYPVAANDKALLSTEAPLPDQLALELSRAAFTPVVGKLRAKVAVLTSAVTVYRWQPSRLTTEGTLGYQILAGRLAQFCTLLLESLPAGDPAASVEFLRGELAGFLGPLAGEVAGAAGEATAGAAAGATTATTAGAGTGAAEAHAGAVTVELITQEVEGVSRPFAQVAVRPQAPIEGKPIDFQFLLPLRG